MIRELSREAAEHDNASAKPKRGKESRHQRDKREKKERVATEYRATVALAREAGSRIVDGIFDEKGEEHSFCFRFYGGRICREKDAAKYTRAAIKMSAERAVYQRTKEVTDKDGKTILRPNGHGRYAHGAVSMISSVAPWQVATIKRLPQDERDLLLLQLAEVEAKTIKDVSGREVFGGSAHYDTAVPHRHIHVPKTDKDGNIYPKADFLTAGGATVGWDRIIRQFGEDSGLVSEQNLERYRSNLAKKYDNGRKLIDVECARACDDFFVNVWLQKNPEYRKSFQKDCLGYSGRKIAELKAGKHRPLMSAAVDEFVTVGIWPLAYQAMNFAMWRLIPRDIRPVVVIAIRTTQAVRRPLRLVKQAVRVVDMLAVLERTKEMPPIERISMR